MLPCRSVWECLRCFSLIDRVLMEVQGLPGGDKVRGGIYPEQHQDAICEYALDG